jgi:hypothetical protein
MPVTINGTNGLTFNNSSTQAQSAGLGSSATAQTWQNVTASRVAGTVYTNSTGYPIEVAIRQATNGFTFYVGGVIVLYSENGFSGYVNTVSAVVPNGATYYSTNGFTQWNELR